VSFWASEGSEAYNKNFECTEYAIEELGKV